MIKKFIEKVFGTKKPRKQAGAKERIYAQAEHGIRREELSNAAISVCEGLHRAGYKAFVVGGAVRDLLLGRHPKDYDVATDATPEQVRAVFRRARIIGRRFKLVHVMFRDETVEVSTFRANHPAADADEKDGRADEHGRLLRDNVYGNQQEDAIRRDFTMNALFYDPEREEVWDCVNGFADIKQKRVVMIGDPTARYREDPVRMMRAARLAAKLGFTIDAATEAPIAELAPLLDNVPTARLFDEMLKLLFSGHALNGIEKLRSLGLHSGILPVLDQLFSDPAAKAFVVLALQRTDERIAQDKGVSPPFLFAALFWWPMVQRWRALEAKGVRPLQAMHEAMDDVLDTQRKTLAVPRRLDPLIKELWLAQPRFPHRSQRQAFRTLTHPRFRASYDFYALRAEAGDADKEIAAWWERFQFADEQTQESMLLPDDEPKTKKRRRRKKKTSDGGGEGMADSAQAPAADAAS
ncbi:MAG: polynucleotide adenylyltransferase PcnB [Burkholderiales bacterium]|nr:polynucleotide adenylyltransferase PcnB [Burkholderiales bacterium]